MSADDKKATPPLRTTNEVKWIVFTHDGKRIIAGCDADQRNRESRYEILSFDVDTGKACPEKASDRAGIYVTGAVSPDGKYLLTGGYEGSWRLWSLPDLKLVAKGQFGIGRLHRVAFAPDGKTFSILQAKYFKRLTDPIKSSRVTYWVKTFRTSDREVIGEIELWPRELTLGDSPSLPRNTEPAGWTRYGPPKLAADGRPIPPKDKFTKSLITTDEPESVGGPMTTEISLDHSIAITTTVDNQVIFWDYKTRQPIGKPLTSVSNIPLGGIAISPDSRNLAVVGLQKLPGEERELEAVTVFEIASQKKIAGPFRTLANTTVLEGIAFSPDGTKVAIASAHREEGADKYSGLIGIYTISNKK